MVYVTRKRRKTAILWDVVFTGISGYLSVKGDVFLALTVAYMSRLSGFINLACLRCLLNFLFEDDVVYNLVLIAAYP